MELPPLQATGQLQPLEASYFMYGTHVLNGENGELLYALQSTSLNLDTYIGKSVRISGTRISGYPVEGGPVYLEVTQVEMLNR
ncbi:hypothetical protein [Cesiribacter andamanensis]|nr:hypothetical protein [Cesiribacter andamanensis]